MACSGRVLDSGANRKDSYSPALRSPRYLTLTKSLTNMLRERKNDVKRRLRPDSELLPRYYEQKRYVLRYRPKMIQIADFRTGRENQRLRLSEAEMCKRSWM
jgi:hypothetical protein